MTVLAATLLTLACCVVVVVFVLVWRAIPVFPCPNCQSPRTDDVSVDERTYMRCLDCAHEWQEV